MATGLDALVLAFTGLLAPFVGAGFRSSVVKATGGFDSPCCRRFRSNPGQCQPRAHVSHR